MAAQPVRIVVVSFRVEIVPFGRSVQVDEVRVEAHDLEARRVETEIREPERGRLLDEIPVIHVVQRQLDYAPALHERGDAGHEREQGAAVVLEPCSTVDGEQLGFAEEAVRANADGLGAEAAYRVDDLLPEAELRIHRGSAVELGIVLPAEVRVERPLVAGDGDPLMGAEERRAQAALVECRHDVVEHDRVGPFDVDREDDLGVGRGSVVTHLSRYTAPRAGC